MEKEIKSTANIPTALNFGMNMTKMETKSIGRVLVATNLGTNTSTGRTAR